MRKPVPLAASRRTASAMYTRAYTYTYTYTYNVYSECVCAPVPWASSRHPASASPLRARVLCAPAAECFGNLEAALAQLMAALAMSPAEACVSSAPSARLPSHGEFARTARPQSRDWWRPSQLPRRGSAVSIGHGLPRRPYAWVQCIEAHQVVPAC